MQQPSAAISSAAISCHQQPSLSAPPATQAAHQHPHAAARHLARLAARALLAAGAAQAGLAQIAGQAQTSGPWTLSQSTEPSRAIWANPVQHYSPAQVLVKMLEYTFEKAIACSVSTPPAPSPQLVHGINTTYHTHCSTKLPPESGSGPLELRTWRAVAGAGLRPDPRRPPLGRQRERLHAQGLAMGRKVILLRAALRYMDS
jgi:hypothetical protein